MNNKINNIKPKKPDVLAELRRLMPARRLWPFEHYGIAERQAGRLHQLLGQSGPAASMEWLAGNELPGLTVVLQPRWKMEGLSGMSTWTVDEGWVIGVNKGNPHARRRFTLAHEFKHVLDANRDKITYGSVSATQREQIADYFAACYLMPKLWVRRSWTGGLQDAEALAGLFNVSQQAMQKRLSYLQYIDEQPGRSVTSYFRRENNWLAAAPDAEAAQERS